MASRSFFIQNPEDALRHVDLLAKGLNKLAIAGWVAGGGCTILAALVGHFLVTRSPQPNGVPGLQEISGVTLVAWFMAIALLFFSSLYFVAGRGLARRKSWARHTAAGVFMLKVLLCVWLGRGSVGAMIVFLTIAAWDLYGLWVLMAKETGQLFTASESQQPSAKPANLVT
jgi:hypothetical protein